MLANRWLIDGYDLYTAYKVIVKTAEGLDVIPKVKKREQHDWPDESGLEISTATSLVYDSQDISLSCAIIDTSYKEAVKRINGLIALLSGSGYHLLGSTVRGKLYPVLLDSVSSYKRLTNTNAGEVGVEFTVKLICPLPECRMGTATVAAYGVVNITPNTGKRATAWWGDGTSQTGVGVLSHTYSNAGTYTILVAGTGVTLSTFSATGATIEVYALIP